MPRVAIEISELRDRDGKKVKDLAEFLKVKTGAKIDVGGGEIIINYGEKFPPKAYLRVLLRKFLHKAKLKEEFRVISGKENTFIIKEKKRAKVEE